MIETTVQNSEELDVEIDMAGDSVEHVLLETKGINRVVSLEL